MENNRKIALFILGLILAGTLVAVFFPKEGARNENALLRLGAGDDVSGILMEETADELGGAYAVSDNLESSCFQDCWSNIAQWALSAEEINVAFYCGHIALHTIEKNDNVMIYGPVVMNAEVLCYREPWEEVRTVGISQGRQNEKEQARKTYPRIEGFQEVTQKGILYSLENGTVDAVVQDLTKAAKVPDYPCKPLSETDYVSYVLVVDKDFIETEAFADFIEGYNRAVKRLNDADYLAEKLGVETEWLADKKLQFLSLALP